MAIKKRIGNFFDRVGTKYNLPEIGLSEYFAGEKTANTGRVNHFAQPLVSAIQNYGQVNQAAEPEDTRPEWQVLGYPNEQSYIDDALLSGNTNLPGGSGYQQSQQRQYRQPAQPQVNIAQSPVTAPAVAPQGAPLPGDPLYEPRPIYFQGQVYDLNDPSQRQMFSDARSGYARNIYGEEIANIDRNYQEAFDESDRSYGSAIGSLDQDTQDLRRNFEDYEVDYGRNVRDVNEGYDLGSVRRANYFAKSSPLAYQSSQGSSEQYAMGKKDEGLADYARARESDTQMMTRQEAALARERADLERNYNMFRTNSEREIAEARRAATNQYQGFLDSNATELTGLSQAQKVAPANFGRQQYDPMQFQSVDTSKFTPYTNFQQVAQSPQANFFKTFQPKLTKAQDPTDEYLGRTPQAKKQKDPLAAYLRG